MIFKGTCNLTVCNLVTLRLDSNSQLNYSNSRRNPHAVPQEHNVYQRYGSNYKIPKCGQVQISWAVQHCKACDAFPFHNALQVLCTLNSGTNVMHGHTANVEKLLGLSLFVLHFLRKRNV